MEFEQQFVLSLVGIIVGFALSQSINVLKFIRRPKFQIEIHNNGIVSCYTGAPPETPSEVILGFTLKNMGFNPAINTRIFISSLDFSSGENEPFSNGIFEFCELAKPINIIPPGESVTIVLGKIVSNNPHLDLNLVKKDKKKDFLDFVEADTRGQKSFATKIQITCDSIDSFTTFALEFHPAKDEFAESILADMPNNNPAIISP